MKIIKYFFEFILIILLFGFFKIVGLKKASFFGKIIGKVFGPFFRPKILIKKNIKNALGDLPIEKQEQIIENMWSNLGSTLAEYIYLKKFKNSQKHINIIGKETLEKIKKSNEPFVFFSGHFGNFELMAMELNKFGIKLAAIYRPLNNIFLNPIMEYFRLNYICPFQIPKGKAGTRKVVEKFKKGYSIAIMADQSVTEGQKINFFNKLASTTTIPARLALKYNCQLVPIFLERKNGANFEMTVHKPLNLQKTGNTLKDSEFITLKINQEIEKMILKNPNQWIWTHNRWK